MSCLVAPPFLHFFFFFEARDFYPPRFCFKKKLRVAESKDVKKKKKSFYSAFILLDIEHQLIVVILLYLKRWIFKFYFDWLSPLRSNKKKYYQILVHLEPLFDGGRGENATLMSEKFSISICRLMTEFNLPLLNDYRWALKLQWKLF